jgi:hypothetical protein
MIAEVELTYAHQLRDVALAGVELTRQGECYHGSLAQRPFTTVRSLA